MTRKQRVTVTPEVATEVRRLRYQDHVPVGEIASRTGVSVEVVSIVAPVGPVAMSPRDERIVELFRSGHRQMDIAAEVGVLPPRVSKVLLRARVSGLLGGEPTTEVVEAINAEADTSLKERILRKVVENGPYETTDALMDACRNGAPKAYATHEFVHLMYSLQKQNLITFRQSRRPGLGSVGPTKIVATKRGLDAAAIAARATDSASAATVAATDALATDAIEEAIVEPGASTALVEGSGGGWRTPTEMAEKTAEWAALVRRNRDVAANATTAHKDAIDAVPVPLLAALVAREAEREASKVKAQKYLEAAAILADVDKAASDDLLERAGDSEGKPFTPIEAEYLAFAHAVDTSFTTLRDTIGSI